MSLRERLRERARPSLVYELPVGDVGGAVRALAEAEEAYSLVAFGTDDDEDAAAARVEAKETARQAIERARENLAACYERIELTAMPPDDYEALKALHEPRPDTDDTEWNAATFPKACFLACVALGDLGTAGWEDVLRENVSKAEREDLYAVARTVNIRLVNPALPKG